MAKENKKPQIIQRRKTRQQRSVEKYEAVLDACSQLLLDKGYAKTSMLELSLESGVAVPSIYQYFENKEEIFRLWFERLSGQVFERLQFEEVDFQQGDVVELFIRRALELNATYRVSARALLNDLPQTLSSNMISGLEDQTLDFVEKLFGEALFHDTVNKEKLKLLIRLLLGYTIQIILNTERELNIEFETQQLSIVVKSYLSNMA